MNFIFQTLLFTTFIFFVVYLYYRFGKENVASEIDVNNREKERNSKRRIISTVLTGTISLVFFLTEMGLFHNYNSAMFAAFIENPESRLTPSEGRRFFNYQMKKLLEQNRINKRAIYTLGGSSAREYFQNDKIVSKQLGIKTINLGSHSQQLLGTIRIVDQIETPGSVIVYVFRAGKFSALEESRISKVNYLNGSDYPYFLESNKVLEVMEDYKNKYGNHGNKPKFSYRFAAKINPYVYALKDAIIFVKWKLNRTGLNNLFHDERPIIQNMKEYRNKVRPTSLKRKKHKKGRNSEEKKEIVRRSIEINFYFLEQLYLLCEQKGYQFIILDLPQRNESSLIMAKMKNLENKYNNIVHIEIPPYMMKGNQNYFADTNHLNDQGRAYYFPYIVKSLKPLLGN
ncbi:MAG: hypothetical protein ABUK01_00915 [Leptospirales bacterium]